MIAGVCTYLGIGVARREPPRAVSTRIVRGGFVGAFIDLVCACGAQIKIIGYAAGFSHAARTILTPATCGAVIGVALGGGEILLAGNPLDQWRRYWPLFGLTLVVLINAFGPVLLVQYYFINNLPGKVNLAARKMSILSEFLGKGGVRRDASQ